MAMIIKFPKAIEKWFASFNNINMDIDEVELKTQPLQKRSLSFNLLDKANKSSKTSSTESLATATTTSIHIQNVSGKVAKRQSVEARMNDWAQEIHNLKFNSIEEKPISSSPQGILSVSSSMLPEMHPYSRVSHSSELSLSPCYSPVCKDCYPQSITSSATITPTNSINSSSSSKILEELQQMANSYDYKYINAKNGLSGNEKYPKCQGSEIQMDSILYLESEAHPEECFYISTA